MKADVEFTRKFALGGTESSSLDQRQPPGAGDHDLRLPSRTLGVPRIRRLAAHPFDDLQALDCLRVPDLPVRRKHGAQFERQHAGIVSTYVSIRLSYCCRRLAVQASRLKQDRYAIETNDGVNLSAIKRDNVIAGLVFDIR